MDDVWHFLHLPPLAGETALHIDLASALIALLALLFSFWTWRHQNRLRRRVLLAQRDSGLIHWIELTIDTIVGIEFFLRSWTPTTDFARCSAERNDHLAKLAATIDKGRLYFPTFMSDVVVGQSGPRPPSAEPARKRRRHKTQLMLLDCLVEIYDLTKDVDLENEKAVQQARQDMMITKRDFVSAAQNEVEFRRVPGIIE
jgi:hypothetical protein